MKFTEWKENIETLSQELKGTCQIIRHLSGQARVDFFDALFEIEYLKNKLTIVQSFIMIDPENGKPGRLRLTYKFHNRNGFNLTISERDFFDKIFNSKRILTKNQEFDKRFMLKSSDENAARKIFEDDSVQKFFLENHSITLNTFSEHFETELRLNLSGEVNNNTQILSIIELFKSIIDKIVNVDDIS